jgi:uncharacterized protein with FMN-binding domain
MSTPAVLAQVLDFENVIATAVVNTMVNSGFVAAVYTGLSEPGFQKKRPRAEVQYKHGGMELPLRQLPDGTFRASAFHGEVIVAALTDSRPDAKVSHGQYRAQIRNFFYSLPVNVNNTVGGLTLHAIKSAVESGTSQGFKPEAGEEVTVITFRVQWVIMIQGWNLLST